MSEMTVKCHICGKPYKVYMFTVADQSACPECVQEAQRATSRKSNDSEILRRDRYFNHDH